MDALLTNITGLQVVQCISMGLFGEWSVALHKKDQMLAQKVCLRLVIELLYHLLTLVAEYIIALPSVALYCNVAF